MLAEETYWVKNILGPTKTFYWEEGELDFVVQVMGKSHAYLCSYDHAGERLLCWRVFRRRTEPFTLAGTIGDFMESFILKSQAAYKERRAAPASRDESFAAEWPALHEYLTVTSLEGKNRKTTSLNIFSGDGLFKMFVNDRELDRAFCVSAKGVVELFTAAELQLMDDSCEWRPAKGGKKS